jgi:tRNA threonylcarbamoyladenosine biosynthesis protein TsaE
MIRWMSDQPNPLPVHRMTVVSSNAEQTEALGEALGKRLRGGEVIELVSDLGGGKTTLVRGLARGAGSQDHVASPTFTMSRRYDAGDLHIEHFDFYRLSEPGIMADELAEFIGEPDTIVIIEWSDIVQHVLPAERLTIQIKHTGETERTFSLAIPAAFDYLLKDTA